MGYSSQKEEHFRAFDKTTGESLWQYQLVSKVYSIILEGTSRFRRIHLGFPGCEGLS